MQAILTMMYRMMCLGCLLSVVSQNSFHSPSFGCTDQCFSSSSLALINFRSCLGNATLAAACGAIAGLAIGACALTLPLSSLNTLTAAYRAVACSCLDSAA